MSGLELQRIALAAGSTVLFLAACNDSTSPTEPEVEEVVEVATVTETFSGDLDLGEISCHLFVTTQTGDVDMEMTGVAPLATLTLGLGIGLPDENADGDCALFGLDQSVRLGEILQSASLTTAEYCVCIFDVGNIFATETVTYTVDVKHP